MNIVRADRKEDWLPPIDTEIFNEAMHLAALSDILTLEVKANLF